MRSSSSASGSSRPSTAARHGTSAGRCVDQPVAQRPGGTHVVLVVVGDPVEARLVVRRHPALVLDDRARALVDLVAALVVGEPLDVLEAVALDTDLHRPLHDRQQVDELAGGDQLFEREFGDAVLGHQPLQRRSLGVVVVVHVHVRELHPAGGEVIDERLRRRRPPRPCRAPRTLELPLAGGRLLDQAEQEEQLGVGVPERVALEVEEHVAVVGRRERGEPDRVGSVEVDVERGVIGGRRRGEQLERRLVVGSVAGLHLEAGLADERVLACLVEVGHLTVELRERCDRRHAVLLERRAVGGADAGDVHERIGGAPVGVAHHLELAELAVVARLGTRVGVGASSASSFASWPRRRRQ